MLSLYGGKLNYTKLIKLLYLADRQSISDINVSITGDTYASLPLGPILNTTYQLIRGEGSINEQAKWDISFEKDNFMLVQLRNIPTGKLSKYEMKVLSDIAAKYRNVTYSNMIDVLHNPSVCPEWKDPHNSSLLLSKRDILAALGRTEDEITEIEEDDAVYAQEDKIFAELEKA